MTEVTSKISKTQSKHTVILNENEFYDREGNLCSRVRPSMANQYDVPEDVLELEPGWTFQWCRHSVKGNLNMNELSVMQRAGWRPSNPEVMGGFFKEMISPDEKQIIIDGSILMERPQHITEKAQRESENIALRQLAQQVDSIREEDQFDLPQGVKMMKREIDHGRYEKVKVKAGRKKQQSNIVSDELSFSLD